MPIDTPPPPPRTDRRLPLAGSTAGLDHRARENYRLMAIILACYLIDALLLGGYALLGTVPLALPLAYAATGVMVAGTCFWLSRHHSAEVLTSGRSVMLQTSVALLLVLGAASLYPVVGLPMVLTAVIIIASSALRLPPASLMAIIVVATVGAAALITRKSAPPAFPVASGAEQAVTALFLLWTMLKSASINAVGSQLRKELDQSHADLLRALGQVERLAEVDELTELPNRRSILRQLAQARARGAGSGEPLGVGMLDIDHFKRINDGHGHPVGDAVLRGVAAALKAGLRAGDLVGRVGGEEFVVLLHGPFDAERLVGLGERTRQRIEAHDWDAIVPGLRVTASLGVTLGRPDEPVEAWLARADQALYRAKDQGRNRVALEDAAAAVAASDPATATAPDPARERVAA